MQNISSVFSYILLLIFSIHSSTLCAQSTIQGTKYKVSKLRGVPQNDVNSIFQDSRGFIWIGTLDGLHRFDGYVYKTYQTSNKENTINSNLISSIDEDGVGNIWISSFDKGICKLNPATEKITNFSDQIKYNDSSLIYDVEIMCIDENNSMWLAHKNEVIRVTFDKTMNKVIDLSVLLETTSEAKAIYYDTDGQLWIGASHHLIRVQNPYSSKDQIKKDLYNLHVQSICESENEIIALGGALYVFSKDGDKTEKQYTLKTYEGIIGSKVLYYNDCIWTGGRNGVTCYTRDVTADWARDTDFNGNFGSLGLGSNVVFSLMLDPASGIWVGTRGSGINRIDLNPKRFEHYKHTLHPGSLSNNLVRCIFQDSYGQLWIGTEEKGVNVLGNPQKESFAKHFKYLSVNETKQADGVYTAVEMETPGSKEHESLVWLGTTYYTGIVGINPHTLQIVRNSPQLSQVGFAFATEVYDSMLWIGTYRKGLWRFILDDSGNVVSYDHFMPGEYVGAINSDIIRSLLHDSKGNLWVGTDKGLHCVESQEVVKKTPLFKDYTNKTFNTRFGFDYILQIFEDTKGKIWVGTMGNGLLCYNQAEMVQEVVFKKIAVDNMLPNNTIKSIVEDDRGYIWLATNKGISRLNPENLGVTNYDEADGLQDNEFSEISGTKLNDGRIIMGGINGFNVFAPESIQTDESKPKLFFTKFSINNKLVQPGQKINGRILLKKSIDFSKSVELKYRENSFTIGFVGIHYKSPNRNNYEYKLEGFDKEWLKTSPQYRSANYTNIPSGVYTFMVKGSNSDNQWSEEPIALSIRIYPPFYRSWLAFFIYALTFFASIYFYLQNRKAKEVERNKLLIAEMEKKQVEELSKMRQQFFTNISHEFKTPLTLIKGPLERLQNNSNLSEKDKQDNYSLIEQNVYIMMRLISQLMDFRKLDQNKMEVTYSKVGVNKFVEKIYKSFELWTEQKELDFTFTPCLREVYTALDKNKTELVLYNIISNAIKNTPNQGKVNVRVDDIKAKDEFTVVVSDTGVGIAQEDQPHIFERFYQTKGQKHKNSGGTGIGLAHAKGLAELQKGYITFESELGAGSAFVLHMPVNLIDNDVEIETKLRIEEEINLVKGSSVESIKEKKQDIQYNLQTVLVVEDNFDLRNFIAKEFKGRYNVILAEDGVEGLRMAEKYNPDIIVSDVMMPNMDGVEMCKRIKEKEAISHIPVILLTSKTSEDSQIEGYEKGADAYVAKPLSIEVFKHRIQSILKNRNILKEQFHKELKINPMIISNTDADVKFMETILGLIEEHLSDPEFNVDKLAKAYGVSRVYLGKKIKALTGESPIQFQRTVRLKHAAILFQQGNSSVSQVAWGVGYNDVNTFRQRFKEYFEMTPSEYRKKFLNTEEE